MTFCVVNIIEVGKHWNIQRKSKWAEPHRESPHRDGTTRISHVNNGPIRVWLFFCIVFFFLVCLLGNEKKAALLVSKTFEPFCHIGSHDFWWHLVLDTDCSLLYNFVELFHCVTWLSPAFAATYGNRNGKFYRRINANIVNAALGVKLSIWFAAMPITKRLVRSAWNPIILVAFRTTYKWKHSNA